MRILKFFFFALLWILIIGALVFFVGREVILILGAGTIKSDYRTLLKKNYAELCTKQFSYSQDYSSQIRFTSNKEYNLEVVCSDFASSPILIESKKLPPLLFKESFGSGFIIDQRKLPSFVELRILGRSFYLYAEDLTIHSNYLTKPDLDYDQGPISSCQAHNYQCCNSDLQSGSGEQFTAVNDCPKSCYESCLLRPLFLSFNSRPALDETTRLVEVYSGEATTFSYVLGNGKSNVFSGQLDKNAQISWLDKLQAVFSKPESDQLINQEELTLPVTIKIDFGDGEVWEGTDPQGMVDHTYVCRTRTCYFQAEISAQDARGALSANNELAKMVVKVNR